MTTILDTWPEAPRHLPYACGGTVFGIPAEIFASPEFNAEPLPLRLPMVEATCGPLFEMLDQAGSAAEAAEAFHLFMAATFGLEIEHHEPGPNASVDGTRRYRSSYLRLLRGWSFDSNGPEGAVLKGWVESRFGLMPTWHGERIDQLPCPAWLSYIEQKMGSRFHNNAIFWQLDIVYAFCQWMLAKFFLGESQHIVLYRGVSPLGEDQVVRRLDRRRAVVRLNNLNSFSADRGVADCFGDLILTTRVPAVKVLFCTDLLPRHPLKSEAEYLVVGGDYEVEMSLL